MNIFKKTFFELIAVLAILLVILLAVNFFVDEEDTSRFIQASLADQEITLEVADNQILQRMGLSNREYLEENHGMIFVYEEEIEGLSFWMKDTLIPLDMIFLNSDFEVVDIIENVPICEEDECPSYTSEQVAKYVIELNAGWVEENNLEIGDFLETIVQDQSDS